MSMVLTRSPLEPIGMNGASRRSTRLSAEGADENGDGPSARRSKTVGTTTTTAVGTKGQDGDAGAVARRKKRVYDEEDDGFTFSKSKKPKAKTASAVRNSDTRRASPDHQPRPQPVGPIPAPVPSDEAATKTGQKKNRRKLPTTPEQDAANKVVRRSKRLSDENTSSNNRASPHKPAHARSHAKPDRSPSPEKARPLTIERKRKRGADGVEEEKVMRIQLPFADTPVIKRNKEMRKASAEHAYRRSSSGMRGRRASSLIDEGRGNGELESIEFSTTAISRSEATPSTGLSQNLSPSNRRTRSNTESESGRSGLTTPPPSGETEAAVSPTTICDIFEQSADEPFFLPALPHSEVPAAEFYKHISAGLTEPRRMRCLLGWCGTRTLPPKPEAPKDSSPASIDDFHALQAARVIQGELLQDLITKGVLSDWFSRDVDVAPRIPLRKKPNPRNVANAAKADELERELDRLKKERSEWNALLASAAQTTSTQDVDLAGDLSPLQLDLLDSPQRAILEQLQAPASISADPDAIQQRVRNISERVEFTIDQFAHGVHALTTAKETAERLADQSLGDAADVLKVREKESKVNGKSVDAMDALRGLARVLNSGKR